MTATTGPKLTIPFTVGTATPIVGQGDKPEPWLLYSTDDVDTVIPTWTSATEYLRAANVSRGRESELDRVDAGVAELVLNARDRVFDPIENTALRPMNRWWLREMFSGETQDVFKGYAESYDLQWPAAGYDSVTVVRCVDEMKVLALDRLPTTDPPRDSYQECVLFDDPAGYWAMGVAEHDSATAVRGEPLRMDFTANFSTGDGAIVGQDAAGYTLTVSTGFFTTSPLQPGQSGDVGTLDEFAIEGWFATLDGLPGSTEILWRSPLSGATWQWQLSLTTAGLFVLEAKNSGGSNHSLTSTTALRATPDPTTTDTWLHVVGTITAGNLRLYVNGTQEGSTAWSGSFGDMDADSVMIVGNNGVDIGGSEWRAFDELAFYRTGLNADRVAAHYRAGVERGFARSQTAGVRIGAVLDSSHNHAPRSLRPGTRPLLGAYMTGQPVLDELRSAEAAEAVDAVLFIAGDGTVTFLDDGHRSSSPWDTVQATFDDAGSFLPYETLDLDYSEAFLYNDWNVTRSGGTTTSASDTASIAAYWRRPQSLTGLNVRDGADATAIAAAMLAKYKDPMVRIQTIELSTVEPDVTQAAFALDLGDRVRVLRNPIGGGSTIDQTLFVQRIDVDMDPNVWRIRLGVSPL